MNSIERRVHTLFLLVALAAAFGARAAAQPVSVFIPDSDPTSGSCNVVPFGATFYDSARYQVLVPRGDLPGPGRIVNVAFAGCATTMTTISATRIEMRIAHTSYSVLRANFDDNLTTDTTTVFAGTTYSFTPNQWADIQPGQFTTPFDYNGIDNLVIEVRYLNGTGGDDGFHRTTGLSRAFSMGTTAFVDPTADYRDDAALKMRLRMVKQTGGQGALATGDFVAGGQIRGLTGLFQVGSSTPASRQILATPGMPNWVEAGADNQASVYGFAPQLLNGLFRLATPASTPTTICSIAVGGSVQAIAPDFEFESAMVAAIAQPLANRSDVVRVDVSGTCTTLYSIGGADVINAICVGPDGGYALGLAGPSGNIRLIDRDGSLVGDVLPAPLPGLQITSMVYSHRLNEYLVTQTGTPSVFAVDPTTRRIRPIANALVGAQCIRESRGTVGAGSAWVLSSTGFDLIDLGTGVVARSQPIVNALEGFYVDGDNLLTARVDRASPNRVRFSLNAGQANAGRVYLLLLSSGTDGIPVPPTGRMLDLSLSYLLIQSLANPAGVGLSNSNGPLDQNGNGIVELRVPRLGSKPTAFYAAYIVIDPSAPGGIGTISETEIFQLQ